MPKPRKTILELKETKAYDVKIITWLNEFGVLSCALLMRRLRLNPKKAIYILKCIRKDYKEVESYSPCIIYIRGRFKGIKYHRRPSKWKDVMKP